VADEQIPLFSESPEEALRALVAALGGAKHVACAMRPDLPADDAGRWLIKCLDHERAEKLSLSQLLWLLRAGRQAGVHVAMYYFAGEAGYKATAMDPADELAAAQRQFVESVAMQKALVSRIERLTGHATVGTPPSLRPVA